MRGTLLALAVHFAVPGALRAAVVFAPTDGTGSIAREDVVANPLLGVGALVASPSVAYTDHVGYSQLCVKGGAYRTVSVSVPRRRFVKVDPQASDAKPPTYQNITAYLLTGYWTLLLETIPADLCSHLEPGLAPAGPVAEAGSTGGRLTFNCKTKSGDVVIWTAP